jgi:hypothetical protein
MGTYDVEVDMLLFIVINSKPGEPSKDYINSEYKVPRSNLCNLGGGLLKPSDGDYIIGGISWQLV